MKNVYNRSEWAGAFGDLGTLIPFVVGYISVMKLDPLGILVAFGVFLIISGVYYKTPMAVQPMKAIGSAAISQASLITPNMVFGAGLFTGVFWLILGLSGMLRHLQRIASKPVVRGIVLGLGISFIIKGIDYMREDLLVAFVALAVTFLLLNNKRVPAMFVLLVFGIAVTLIKTPAYLQELAAILPQFRVPEFSLGTLSWQELASGIFVLALPQIPLTWGNAIFAATTENNRLFPDRAVSEKQVSVFVGIMNLASPVFGGIPMCQGAGGIAAHSRFGAKTGGAVVILGGLLLILGLFFSNSMLLLFNLIPTCVLGVLLFFAGLELSMSARDVGPEKKDYAVLLVTAGFTIWNAGVGFLVGLAVHWLINREVFKV